MPITTEWGKSETIHFDAFQEQLLDRARSLTGQGNCLWPTEYATDCVECARAFVYKCWTWNETAAEFQIIEQADYIDKEIEVWYENRKRHGTLIEEKCRRMLISWVHRALELWDMGLKKCDGLMVGEDLESASKHVWRYSCLWDQLRLRYPKWGLGELTVHKHQGDRMLRSVTLPNGSNVQYANGTATQIQGEGKTWISIEELSIYPSASSILAQAKILLQGTGGVQKGYVTCITNAKADNPNWQAMKRGWSELEPELLMDGFTRKITQSGAWFLELDWWADKRRDQKWLEDTRLAMADTPFEFQEQILRRDSVSPGSIYTYEMFDKSRREIKDVPEIVTLIVAVDPSVTDPEMRKNPNKLNDECGIFVMGICGNAQAWILKDLSGMYSPDTWAKIACSALQKYAAELKPLRWLLVAEKNQGGELVRTTLKNVWPMAPIELVHATIGKRPRAEPTVQLFEQDRCHLVGRFPQFEREATAWNAHNPGAKSPNRVDALVWGLHAGRMCGSCEVRTHSRMGDNRDTARVSRYA